MYVAISKTLYIYRVFIVWFCSLGLDTHANNNKTYYKDRNCFPFRATWAHHQFIVGFVVQFLVFREVFCRSLSLSTVFF